MLSLVVPAMELYDSEREEFVYTKPVSFEIEHCLLAMSRWESKWKKPFLSPDEKTSDEVIDYIRCMTMSDNVPDDVYNRLPYDVIEQINDYVDAPHSATTIRNQEGSGRVRNEIVTTEVIYYWMTAFGIPFECETWNLDRLLKLIEICLIKSQPAKKMPKAQVRQMYDSLNKARRSKLHSKG